MEHVTCKLLSDFHDYYDHEISSTTQDHEIELRRYCLKPLSLSEQLTQLKKAHLPTPFFGSWKEMRSRLKRQAGSLFFEPSWQQETYIQIESKNGGSELITVEQAETLNDNAFTAEVIDHTLDREPLGCLIYVHIGHYGIWVIKEADGICLPVEKNECLDKNAIAVLNQPLFAIEFGMIDGCRLIPKRYDIAPNLKDLGIDKILTAKEVADALIARIDDSAPEPTTEEETD